MKHLYDLSSDSNHVKFFTWMWGINPAERYKTMCPYFWQYVLSILILPVILLYKIGQAIMSPLKAFWDAYTDRQAVNATKELLAEINSAKSDKDYYEIYNSKCYKYKWAILDLDSNFDTDIFDRIYDRYQKYEIDRKVKIRIKKEKAQAQMDSFKYGTGGTVLSYLIGVGALVGLGLFFHWFVHLFTMAQFIIFLKVAGIVVVLLVALFIVASIIKYIDNSISCDNKVKIFFSNIVFWKYIGLFFVLIWKGIRIIFDMIGNIYKKSCPVIHWDK